MLVFRYSLAILSLLILVGMIWLTAKQYLTTPGLSVRNSEFVSQHFEERKITLPAQPYNDMTDGGIQANLTFSNNLFQATLLVAAALAGLLIAKNDEAKFLLGENAERAMFICTAGLLLLSFVSHGLYLTEVSYLYFLAGKLMANVSKPAIADISDNNVNFLLTNQLRYLGVSLLVAFFTFFSAHILKGRKEDDPLTTLHTG